MINYQIFGSLFAASMELDPKIFFSHESALSVLELYENYMRPHF
jgi:hypothetical protein